ncbi:MAG: hypothetical protein AAGA48_17665 [Myxococcota bacterium]
MNGIHWGLWLGLLTACGPKEGRYDNSLLELGSGFAAKEVCSCLFVSKLDESYCREMARVKPNVARFKVDYGRKTVRARALGLGKQVARFVGDGQGCVLDP